MAKNEKMLDGEPAVQMNVTIKKQELYKLQNKGKLQYLSFSAYVRKLIDADMEVSNT